MPGPHAKVKPFNNRAGQRIELVATTKTPTRTKVSKRPPKSSRALDPTLQLVDPSSPWFIDSRKAPSRGNFPAAARHALKYAVLAPSSHNTQPWRFRLGPRFVDVLADRSRALPVCDPHDRELTISCGCALMHLRLALRSLGLADRVCLLPDHAQPDWLARVECENDAQATIDDLRLTDAILRRRTCRAAFETRPVPDGVLDQMVRGAKDHGATLSIVAGARTRKSLASLVGEADEVQLASRSFRRELALWMHHNRTHSPDGIPGHALGLGELESLVAPLIVRTFDTGHGRAAKDEQLALHSPVLAVLGTDGDSTRDWIDTGQALARVLLTATGADVSSSYLNQPVEIPELRPRLARLVPEAGMPQLVLRFGYAPIGAAVPHTPRRKADELTVSA